jgi:lipopolysaccharide transport system permease protein
LTDSDAAGSNVRVSTVRDGVHAREMVIEARPRKLLPEWKELWEYRELGWFLTWRDLKVRYKQTILGIAWAVIQPVAATLVFTVFFGRLAKMPSDGIAYPVFALTALVPWTFFSNGLALCSNSLVDNAQLVAKVYFPRVLLPLTAVVSGLVDLLIAFAVLMGLLFFYGYGLAWPVFIVPFLVVIAFVACTGVGVLFAALNARYRDVRYLVPFLLQIWLFLTPIAYPASLLPEQWLLVYGLNPMVGVVEGFRWALLGTGTATPPLLLVSALSALLMFCLGQIAFRRMERTFADVI